jgi:hypothetical protein
VDPGVLRAMARWPDVPAVYGWLALDRRGNWLLKDPATGRFAPIGNAALREFIGRNYEPDARGCWYFQNGPQRVFATLHYTPLVLHYAGEALQDHCGRPARATATWLDEEGSVLIQVERGIGLLDDRDLARFAAGREEGWERLPRVRKADVAARFGFVSNPSESLR